MKPITWMKLNFLNDNQNIVEVDNMDDEKYHMDEINQMMKFQNMDETTFLNEKYRHPYVNVCECEIYIFIYLETFILYLGSKYM
jgi:hypothetical protein